MLSPSLHLPSLLPVSTTVLARYVSARAELLLQVWDDQCVGRTICLLAFLPGLVDSKAAGRNSYLEIMKDLTTKQTLKKFGFMWTSVGQQAELEGMRMSWPFPLFVHSDRTFDALLCTVLSVSVSVTHSHTHFLLYLLL